MKHYAVTVVVEAESKDEARQFSGTIGAGPGDQWDEPLTICEPAIVFETVDPAGVPAEIQSHWAPEDVNRSDGLGA